TLQTDTVATGWVSLAPITNVPANGASVTTAYGIVGVGTGDGATPQPSKAVTLTSSIAGFGGSGATSITVFSDGPGATAGQFSYQYRGTGTAGTDAITAQTPAPDAGVGTQSATLDGAAAGTP